MSVTDLSPETRFNREMQAACEKRAARLLPCRYQRPIELDPAVKAWIVDSIAGSTQGLLLTGPTGVGKTHHGYAAAFQVVSSRTWDSWGGARHVPRVEAESTPSLLARCRPGADPIARTTGVGDRMLHDPVDWYASADLLMLDDLGAEKPSEWTGETLYRLIDHRYTYELPTICITNLPLPELGKTIGDRLASRLGQMCKTVVLKGADRRRS